MGGGVKLAIEKRAERSIKGKVFPGCVVAYLKDGHKEILPFGHFTYDDHSPLVEENSVYDVASVTKMVATASSLLALIDQGRVSLNDKVCKFLPEFANYPDKDKITLKHLLTYTLNLIMPTTASLKNESVEKIIGTIIEAPLEADLGNEIFYGNPTAMLMGLVIEKITGAGVDKFAEEYFYEPLKMTQTTFHPEKLDQSKIVPTEVDDWRGGEVRGVVHDEATYTLEKGGHYLGAAGLFSTAGDLLIFLEMLLNKGVYNSRRYLSEGIIEQMHTNQVPNGEREMGLGWDLNNKIKMGTLSSSQVFGHSGFTGTMVVCDPVKKVAVVTLTNRIYPKRSEDNVEGLNSFRRDIADIVFK